MSTARDVHIDAALSNFATGIVQNPNYASDILLPVVPVNKETDYFFAFGNEELKNEYETLRADGAEATEIDDKLEKDSYETNRYALKKIITDRKFNNADPVIQSSLQQKTVRKLTAKIRLDIERRNHEELDDDTVFAHLHPNPKWDAANATILADIDASIAAFEAQAGISPNKIVIPKLVANVMAADDTFLELQKYTKDNLIEGSGLPAYIRNMQMIIPGTRIVTTEPGITEVLGTVWNTDNVLLAYVSPIIDEETFTLGVQFRIRLNGTLEVWVKRWRSNSREGDFYEANIQSGTKILDTNAGYMISDCLT